MLRRAYLNAMKGLETGLTVRDIAVFGLMTCEPGESVEAVRMRIDRFDFDNVPVRTAAGIGIDGDVVGVIEKIKELPRDAAVADVMAPLCESMLISGSVGLTRFLPTIADREYRLVVEESRIMGVVTPSDVVQLPVRLLVFASLIHLEETMTNVIRWHTNDDQALLLERLRPERRGAVDGLLRRQARAGLNPSPIDVMAFGDKADLLFDTGALSEGPADRELFMAFRDLRNRVDHGQDYAETRAGLHDFLHHVQAMGEWIERLTALLPREALALPGDEPRS